LHTIEEGALLIFAAVSICILEAQGLYDRTVDHCADLASCLTHAVAALRGHLAEDLTSGVKSLRASEQRKRAEEALQKAQAELASASRLTMMAQIAASIAHEINQPLTAIVANGSSASKWLAKIHLILGRCRHRNIGSYGSHHAAR
jgi:C4-dicarboxylate-specific signal transduction histidine kinase